MNLPEDIKVAIEGLTLLFNIYRFRHENSKHDKNDPDPEALRAVITQLKTQPEADAAKQSVADRIKANFPSEQAERIKEDLSMIGVLTNPPDLSKRDYWTILTQYTSALQAIAIRYEIFNIHGSRMHGSRGVPLSRTAQAVYPFSLAEFSARLDRRGYPTSVKVLAWLIERSDEFPIVIGVQAHWDGGWNESSITEDVYFSVGVGEGRNWMEFRRVSGSYVIDETQRRLQAEDVRNVMRALKQDIFEYLHKIEAETSTLDAIHADLANVLEKVPKPTA